MVPLVIKEDGRPIKLNSNEVLILCSFIYLIALASGKRKLFIGKNVEFVFYDSQQACHAPAKTPCLSTQIFPVSPQLCEFDLITRSIFDVESKWGKPQQYSSDFLLSHSVMSQIYFLGGEGRGVAVTFVIMSNYEAS